MPEAEARREKAVLYARVYCCAADMEQVCPNRGGELVARPGRGPVAM